MPDPITDRTTTVYDAHADSYAALNAALTPIQHLMDRFQERLPQGRLLDLGCGPGRDATYFAAQGYSVVGLDRSAGQLKLARQQSPQTPFLLGDMQTLPFGPARFDGVWANASLLHLPREAAPGVLAEMRRVIKPGGLLMISLKCGEGSAWVTSPAFGGEQRFFTYYQPNEIEVLLKAAGFGAVLLTRDTIWLNAFAAATTAQAQHD